jgi:hypothetical protein
MTRYTRVCVRCWQDCAFPIQELDLSKPPVPHVCDACRALDRAPQGEAMNLFTPAPTQMAGQTHLEGC